MLFRNLSDIDVTEYIYIYLHMRARAIRYKLPHGRYGSC
jgi:hypothetical protein